MTGVNATALNWLNEIGKKAKTGRGERIRTSGLYVPNVALYQAKLHPAGFMTGRQFASGVSGAAL